MHKIKSIINSSNLSSNEKKKLYNAFKKYSKPKNSVAELLGVNKKPKGIHVEPNMNNVSHLDYNLNKKGIDALELSPDFNSDPHLAVKANNSYMQLNPYFTYNPYSVMIGGKFY